MSHMSKLCRHVTHSSGGGGTYDWPQYSPPPLLEYVTWLTHIGHDSFNNSKYVEHHISISQYLEIWPLYLISFVVAPTVRGHCLWYVCIMSHMSKSHRLIHVQLLIHMGHAADSYVTRRYPWHVCIMSHMNASHYTTQSYVVWFIHMGHAADSYLTRHCLWHICVMSHMNASHHLTYWHVVWPIHMGHAAHSRVTSHCLWQTCVMSHMNASYHMTHWYVVWLIHVGHAANS